MQSICKFDDDNANVLGHRQKHFAQVERLLLVHRGNFDRRELCHAIYQFGDSFAKTFLNVFKRSRSVFDRIMQNSCDNGVFIHMQVFCKDITHFDRVIDIRLARLAVLFGVITRGKGIRCIDTRTHLIIKAQRTERTQALPMRSLRDFFFAFCERRGKKLRFMSRRRWYRSWS